MTQFGGYGPKLKLPGSSVNPNVVKTFEFSDLVTVIDPKMSRELWNEGIEGETRIVPNALNLPAIGNRDSEFTVFNPMGNSSIKEPGNFVEAVRLVGEEEPSIIFKTVSKGKNWSNPIDWLDLDNLEVLPLQPYDQMISLYSEADVIAHFSSAEISPWTVFEAMGAGKPLIAKELGLIQTISKKYIREVTADFGLTSRKFDEKWSDKYWSGEGDHFLHAETPEELAESILELYSDKRKRLRMANNALEWFKRFEDNWKPEDKARTILNEVK